FMAVRMSAQYRNLHAGLREGRVHAAFEWEARDGLVLGWHLFDAETGTVIDDGPRVAPEGDGWRKVSVECELPAEPGRYRVFISPLRENVRWEYEAGQPFVLVEAAVDGAGTRIERVGVTTRAALARRDFVRSLGRATYYPTRTVWRNRSLIRTMVRRDILGR